MAYFLLSTQFSILAMVLCLLAGQTTIKVSPASEDSKSSDVVIKALWVKTPLPNHRPWLNRPNDPWVSRLRVKTPTSDHCPWMILFYNPRESNFPFPIPSSNLVAFSPALVMTTWVVFPRPCHHPWLNLPIYRGKTFPPSTLHHLDPNLFALAILARCLRSPMNNTMTDKHCLFGSPTLSHRPWLIFPNSNWTTFTNHQLYNPLPELPLPVTSCSQLNHDTLSLCAYGLNILTRVEYFISYRLWYPDSSCHEQLSTVSNIILPNTHFLLNLNICPFITLNMPPVPRLEISAAFRFPKYVSQNLLCLLLIRNTKTLLLSTTCSCVISTLTHHNRNIPHPSIPLPCSFLLTTDQISSPTPHIVNRSTTRPSNVLEPNTHPMNPANRALLPIAQLPEILQNTAHSMCIQSSHTDNQTLQMVKHVENGTAFHLHLKNKKLFTSIARTHTTFSPPKPTSSTLYTFEPDFHWNSSPMTPYPQLKLQLYRETTGKINYKSLTSSPCHYVPPRPTSLVYRGSTQNIVCKKIAVSINTKTTKSANVMANPNLVHKSDNAMTNQIARYHDPQPPSQFNTMVNSASSSSSNSAPLGSPAPEVSSFTGRYFCRPEFFHILKQFLWFISWNGLRSSLSPALGTTFFAWYSSSSFPLLVLITWGYQLPPHIHNSVPLTVVDPYANTFGCPCFLLPLPVVDPRAPYDCLSSALSSVGLPSLGAFNPIFLSPSYSLSKRIPQPSLRLVHTHLLSIHLASALSIPLISAWEFLLPAMHTTDKLQIIQELSVPSKTYAPHYSHNPDIQQSFFTICAPDTCHPSPSPVTPFHLAPAGTDSPSTNNFGSAPEATPTLQVTLASLPSKPNPCIAFATHPYPLHSALGTYAPNSSFVPSTHPYPFPDVPYTAHALNPCLALGTHSQPLSAVPNTTHVPFYSLAPPAHTHIPYLLCWTRQTLQNLA